MCKACTGKLPTARGKALSPKKARALASLLRDRKRFLVAFENDLARKLFKVYLNFYKAFLLSPSLRLTPKLKTQFQEAVEQILSERMKVPATVGARYGRRAMEAVKKGAGQKILFTGVSATTTEEDQFLVRFVFPEIENRIREVASQMLNTQVKFLQSTLSAAAMTQTSMQDVAKFLRDKLIPPPGFRGTPAQYAMTVARTETFAAYETGSREAFRALGVSQVEWVVVDDDLLCEECAPHAGEILPNNTMPGRDRPPLHPNCRCTTVPYMGGE